MDKENKQERMRNKEEQSLHNEELERDPGIALSVSNNITDASLVEYGRLKKE